MLMILRNVLQVLPFMKSSLPLTKPDISVINNIYVALTFHSILYNALVTRISVTERMARSVILSK